MAQKKVAKKGKKATKVTTKKLKNYIALVLDRSGSMDIIRKEAKDAFNEQVRSIKKNSKGMDTKVSFATFSTFADTPKLWNVDCNELKELTEEDYRPDGMTAMYDGVGQTIDRLLEAPDATDENTSFLVVVISDGQENNSHKYSSSNIAERVKSLQDTKRWTFTYLGANQDLSQVSKTLNIPMGNMAAFNATQDGMKHASSINASCTANYLTARTVGFTQTMSFYSGDSVKEEDKGIIGKAHTWNNTSK